MPVLDWYGLGKVTEMVPIPISENPDFERMLTSHVERSNLTVRNATPGFTRLTNGFSKKLTI